MMTNQNLFRGSQGCQEADTDPVHGQPREEGREQQAQRLGLRAACQEGGPADRPLSAAHRHLQQQDQQDHLGGLSGLGRQKLCARPRDSIFFCELVFVDRKLTVIV